MDGKFLWSRWKERGACARGVDSNELNCLLTHFPVVETLVLEVLTEGDHHVLHVADLSGLDAAPDEIKSWKFFNLELENW